MGEEHKLIDNVYDVCYPCQDGSYNYDAGTTCKLCPVNLEFCSFDEIILPSGYWRIDKMSEILLTCKKQAYCIGQNNTNHFCLDGHVGVFCEDCDIYGFEWKDRYFRNSNGSCAKCSASNLLQYI